MDISAMGVQIEIRESTPELFDFDVTGHAFGLITQPHVHTRQTERYEILEGAMRLVTPTADIHLSEGDTYELPAGVTHSQIPATDYARIRIQVRPRATSEALFRRFAELSAAGEFTRWGFPKPRATAHLVLDFADDNRAAQPPVAVQRAVARAIAGEPGPPGQRSPQSM